MVSQISPRLCGRMLAIPTAMPPEPLTSSCGNFAGRTVGSLAIVVVAPKVDRVLVQVAQQVRSERSQPALGVRTVAAESPSMTRSCLARR